MKIKRLVFTAAGAFVMASAVALTMWAMRPRPPQPPPPEDLPRAIVVYCFQTNQRSAKSEKIERLMRELLDKSFAAQMKDRKIVWKVVSLDEPENAHLADLYGIGPTSATSIVVVDGRQGDSGPATNYQQKAWALADNKEKFGSYFRGEIERALKEEPSPKK